MLFVSVDIGQYQEYHHREDSSVSGEQDFLSEAMIKK